jgi:flagellar assembly protein FliH
MIKAYSVRYEDEAKKTIDTHLRIDKEIEVKRSMIFQSFNNQEDFVEGLQAVVIEALPSPEDTIEKHSVILDEAKEEAKQIIEQAKKEAEKIKSDAYSIAQKKGYEDGTNQALKELTKKKTELDFMAAKLQQEFDEKLYSLEPQMAEIIAALVEKMTGIIVQDKQDVILYLIDKAIKNLDKSDEYTIKVSKEDYEYVSSRKSLLLEAIGREVPLYIVEDAGLSQNQCFIETPIRVIDCSLDVQLKNLISDIKLISNS